MIEALRLAAPTLPDHEVAATKGNGDPHDEAEATRTIWAAAAEIRERAPRPPVGYRAVPPMQVVRSRVVIGGNRGGSYSL